MAKNTSLQGTEHGAEHVRLLNWPHATQEEAQRGRKRAAHFRRKAEKEMAQDRDLAVGLFLDVPGAHCDGLLEG